VNEAISVFSGVMIMVAVGGLVVAGMTLMSVSVWRLIRRPRRKPRQP